MTRAAVDKAEKKDKPAPVKKAKAPSGPKKSSAYNQYIKKELARLKEDEPDIPHKDRFKKAAQSWAESPDNPKNK